MSPDKKDEPPIETPAVLSSNQDSTTPQAETTEQEQQAADATLVKRLSQVWPPIWPEPAESDITKMEADWATRRLAGRPTAADKAEMTDEEIGSYLIDRLYADVDLEEYLKTGRVVSKAPPPEPKRK